MDTSTNKESRTLAIALGANLPSPIGPPVSTLVMVRPALEKVVNAWLSDSLGETVVQNKISKDLRLRWSPLFETEPIGGPRDQDVYINAVLVVDGPKLFSLQPSKKAAINLLERFLILEKNFGRNREIAQVPCGPRPLDLDLLAWGGLQIQHEIITLPHPRLIERNFVVVPLGEALNRGTKAPRCLPAQPNWQ